MKKALILALLLFNTTTISQAATETTADSMVNETTTTTENTENKVVPQEKSIKGKISFNTTDKTKLPTQVKVMAKTKTQTYVAYAKEYNGFSYKINIPKHESYTLSLDPTLDDQYRVTRTGNNFSLSLIPTEKITYTVHVDNQGTNLIPKNLRLTLFDDGQKKSLIPKVSSNLKTRTYTYTFTVLKDGSHYTAQPKMDNAKQYILTKSNEMTFEYKAKVTTLKGNVRFIDSTDDVRPSQVIVNIMNQNQLVATTKASASQQWQFQSKALPLCDENGLNYDYHLKGQNIPFYQTPVVNRNIITYQAKWWTVPIEKVDQTTQKPLKGGVIQIVDQATGKVIVPVHGTLPVNKTYKAVTKVAPYGYKKAQPIEFRLLNDGTLQVKDNGKFVTQKAVTIPYAKASVLPESQGGNSTTLPNFKFPSLDLSTDGLPSLDLSKFSLPSLDLPDLSTGSFPSLDLPNLDLSSDSSNNDTKSNGGLGNFSDLFSASQSDDLPQTGNHHSVVLPIVGIIFVIIAGGIACMLFRKK